MIQLSCVGDDTCHGMAGHLESVYPYVYYKFSNRLGSWTNVRPYSLESRLISFFNTLKVVLWYLFTV